MYKSYFYLYFQNFTQNNTNLKNLHTLFFCPNKKKAQVIT